MIGNSMEMILVIYEDKLEIGSVLFLTTESKIFSQSFDLNVLEYNIIFLGRNVLPYFHFLLWIEDL